MVAEGDAGSLRCWMARFYCWSQICYMQWGYENENDQNQNHKETKKHPNTRETTPKHF